MKDRDRNILNDAKHRATHYLDELSSRRVSPEPRALEALETLRHPLPASPTAAVEIVRRLDEIGSPATVASAGPRYFGFVTGGTLPAALAANWIAGAWDQNAGFVVGSPIATRLEEVALSWIRDLLGLPDTWEAGFVTGTTMGNFSGLAVGRHTVLQRSGWDVEKRGLFGAPEVNVFVGEEAHSTLFKALALVGLGRERVVRVPVDGQGQMDARELPTIEPPAIVCLQAGNVNTGGFDPIREVSERAHEAGAWVHVDGAFGLWAAASPKMRHLVDGIDTVDSIATDLHKWLNVPYDSGLALYRDPAAARAALSMRAAYLPDEEARQPYDYTPEASRRARGIEIWAALLSLGKQGVADLVERCCRHARRFAEGFRRAGFEVPNEVVLNQVLVRFGDDETTRRVIDAVQREGTCWCGGTIWCGRAAMRVSVSSWATTEDDVEQSLEAIVRVANDISG
jgi:glutamate/tyrosine decarboxylase-like PLP-dependent enzyme